MKKFLSFSEIQEMYSGRLSELVLEFAPDLKPVFDGRGQKVKVASMGLSMRAEKSFDRSGSWHLNHFDGCAVPPGQGPFHLLSMVTGMDMKSLHRAINERLGFGQMSEEEISRQKAKAKKLAEESARKAEKAERQRRAWAQQVLTGVWDRSKIHLLSTPGAVAGQAYLANRGIDWRLLPARWDMDVAFHPNFEVFKGREKMGESEALLFRLRCPGFAPGTIQTILLKDGLKNHSFLDVEPKRIMPKSRDWFGGGLWVGSTANDTLVVAEGFETLCSGLVLTKQKDPNLRPSGLATISAHGMMYLDLEKIMEQRPIKRLVIFGDRDESQTGQQAAAFLAKRAKKLGFEVIVYLPSKEGVDWNDELQSHGVQGVRRMLKDCEQDAKSIEEFARPVEERLAKSPLNAVA